MFIGSLPFDFIELTSKANSLSLLVIVQSTESSEVMKTPKCALAMCLLLSLQPQSGMIITERKENIINISSGKTESHLSLSHARTFQLFIYVFKFNQSCKT
jgi:hypothetical protein